MLSFWDPDLIVSAPPVEIPPGSDAVSLQLTLSQLGNSAYEVMRSRR